MRSIPDQDSSSIYPGRVRVGVVQRPNADGGGIFQNMEVPGVEVLVRFHHSVHWYCGIRICK
jgi:hypothetical protein